MTVWRGAEACAAWLLLLSWVAVAPSQAQWAPNGIPVTTGSCGAASRGDCQAGARVVPDAAGGAIVAWRDTRAFLTRDTDIYAQHVTAEGTTAPGWPADGFPICTDSAYQDNPNIIADGAGGAYIVWIDRRNGMTTGIDHIFLQRVTAAGAIAPGWTPNGVAVCPTPGDQNGPSLALDGAGGVFVVWEDFRRGLPNEYSSQVDIYAQRITPAGTVAEGWPAEGLPVCTAAGARISPHAVADDAGGLFVQWEDARSPEFHIYAMRLAADGTIAPGWVADGVPICTAPNGQGSAVMASEGQGGFLVAWVDLRSAPPGNASEWYYDIYAQRMTGSGGVAPGWPENGMPVCTALDLQNYQAIVCDGTGGAIIAWSDYRNYDAGAADLYAQHILGTGEIAAGWPVDGVALSRAPYWQLDPQLVADGAGGALIAYETTDGGNYDIYSQHVTGAGTIAPGWDPSGVPVCVTRDVSYYPAAASDGAMGMIVAWQDSRSGYLIYAQHVGSDFPTPTLVSLVGTEVEPDKVVLTWLSPERLSARVYRRSERSDWISLGPPHAVGTDHWVFEDRGVTEGRYAYRLGYAGATGEVFTPEVWVSVPGLRLALAGFRPNPARGQPTVALSLVSDDEATLEVIDAAGRTVVTKRVGSLGPGTHVVALGRETRFAPGVYWLRLRQRDRSASAKGLVLQ